MHTMLGDSKGMQSRHRFLPSQLHDLQFPYDRVTLDGLIQPEEAIGHREYGVVAQLVLDVLTDEKGRRLPARQMERQALNEALQLHFIGDPLRPARDGAERIHDDDARM